MEDQIVSFETAKLARVKGFNWGCDRRYCEYLESQDSPDSSSQFTKGEIKLSSGYHENGGAGDYSKSHYITYTAPTQARLQKWIRENYSFNILIEACNSPITGKWVFEIESTTNVHMVYSWDYAKSVQYDTYEQALEAGITYALDILTSKS